MFWLSVISFIQTRYELAARALNQCRRRWLVPVAHHGGRDMLLLRNGQWVDATPSVPDTHILWRYNSEQHTLRHTSNTEERLARWPWLAVSNESWDLSDFFEGLRISAGQSLPKDNAFMLYLTQKGYLPYGKMTVIKRNGDEEEIHTYESSVTPALTAATASMDVNYIR